MYQTESFKVAGKIKSGDQFALSILDNEQGSQPLISEVAHTAAENQQ